MHFDLTDLRLFAAVVEEGSLTVGASRAGISLPSASARMKGMEEMLGTALLERHRRGVRPTPAGHALFRHSQLVLAQIKTTRRSPQLWPMPSGLDPRFSDVTQS